MSRVEESIRALLWSAWTELGVPGGGRAHEHVVIDPEPLLVATPWLASGDARLLQLTFDWCTQHAHLISATRLKALGGSADGPVLDAFTKFNGALSSHGVHWLPRRRGRRVGRDRRAIPLPMERPALLVFRARALAGVGWRADILARLMFAGRDGLDTAAVAPSGASRRSVERVLVDLEAARLVEVTGLPRKRRFALAHERAVVQLLNAGGLTWPEWSNLLRLAHLVWTLEGRAPLKDSLLRVEAVKAREEMADLASLSGIKSPPPLERREEAFSLLLDWGTRVLRELAAGKMSGPRSSGRRAR